MLINNTQVSAAQVELLQRAVQMLFDVENDTVLDPLFSLGRDGTTPTRQDILTAKTEVSTNVSRLVEIVQLQSFINSQK